MAKQKSILFFFKLIGLISLVYLFYTIQIKSLIHTHPSFKEIIGNESQLYPNVSSLTRDLNSNQIPRIIHQSWKNESLPNQFKVWSETWKTFNPSYKYMLWTDASNRKLIQDHFPWFLSYFDSFEHNIARADAARYFYMYKYGGIYADLDVESVGSLDTVLRDVELALCRMDSSKDGKNKEHMIPNAWMASKPGITLYFFLKF